MRRLLLALAIALSFVAAKQRAARMTAPTFSNEIVRVFQKNCQSCHHPGGIGPFSLMTYAEAAKRAALIRNMVETRQMPPWKPEAGCGDFADARVLPQDTIDLISRWVAAGAPEGDPALLPEPLEFDGGWTIGQPDLVLAPQEIYTPPATGDMYRCFPLPTNLTEDRWVSGIDVLPGDRSSVHHVIAFIDTTGASRALDEADPAPGYTCFGGPGFTPTQEATLGGWAPGYRPVLLPEDVALKLPAGSRVVLQVHYHPHDGHPEADRTQIGIYYDAKVPRKQLYILPLWNTTFTIPPNDPNYAVYASIPIVPAAVHAWVIAPHMHLLGKSMKVEMTTATGQTQCLINIEDWDFNWQAMYRFREPMAIPPLSSVGLKAVYDNSADNPRNPNSPPKPVSWGEATTDEMCIAFIGITIDAQDVRAGQLPDTSWMRRR
jgi:hypothetical protein